MTTALARSEERLRQFERLVGVGSWELSLGDGTITFSDGFGRLLGLPAGAPLNLEAYMRLVHPDDVARVRECIAACVENGSASCEYRIVAGGHEERTILVHAERVPPERDGPRYLRGAALDVTRQRISERERIEALSLFEQGFDGAPIGMILTDVTDRRFIRVNDEMCRLLGRSREELLTLRSEDVTHPDDLSATTGARRAMLDGGALHAHVQKRYVTGDGRAVWADVHVSPVRRADGSVRAFFAQVIDATERREREAKLEHDATDVAWLARIRDAIDNDRLVLYSQPIVDLVSGETIQNELLLRMRDEDGSIIAPASFLPVAERYGLISEIDRWVIRRAAAVAATGTPIQFNLSGKSICDPDVLREIEAAIEDTGADPSLLIVEVTETAIIGQHDVGRVFAERVTALGCQLALDDFGTGFGGLSYLRQIPAQHLKIDIEFVRELTGDDADERVVRGIVGLAGEFDQTTTAEGVEDHATLQRLRELGVHRAQGYLLGRPQPLAEAPAASPGGAVVAAGAAPAGESLAIVRATFDAFASRDIDAALKLTDPEIVLHPIATLERARRSEPYRGHDGLREYFRDAETLWPGVTLEPSTFREAEGSVIAFGHTRLPEGDGNRVNSVLWIWRLRDGLVVSMDVFRTPDDG